jgi:hypothetical protein
MKGLDFGQEKTRSGRVRAGLGLRFGLSGAR